MPVFDFSGWVRCVVSCLALCIRCVVCAAEVFVGSCSMYALSSSGLCRFCYIEWFRVCYHCAENWLRIGTRTSWIEMKLMRVSGLYPCISCFLDTFIE